LKRDLRLSESARFDQIRRSGNCWSDRLLVICLLPNELGFSRFGFAVSRRVGKAVVRNRVRRRVREAVRLRLTDIAAGYDAVFVARPAAAQADYQQIQQSVEKLVRLAGLSSRAMAA
jgi:ribonuclease P protein component